MTGRLFTDLQLPAQSLRRSSRLSGLAQGFEVRLPRGARLAAAADARRR